MKNHSKMFVFSNFGELVLGCIKANFCIQNSNYACCQYLANLAEVAREVRELPRPYAASQDGTVPVQRGPARAETEAPAAAAPFAEANPEAARDQPTATGSKPRVQKVLYNPNDPQFDSIFSMLKAH
jgi:hypothetical protein